MQDSRASVKDHIQPVHLTTLTIMRPYLDTTAPLPLRDPDNLKAQRPTFVQLCLDTTIYGPSPEQSVSKLSIDQCLTELSLGQNDVKLPIGKSIPEPSLGENDSTLFVDQSISEPGRRMSSAATSSSGTLQHASRTPARSTLTSSTDSVDMPQEFAFTDAFTVTDMRPGNPGRL